MRVIVVGASEQGLQWQLVAAAACVAVVRSIQEIPVNSYDAVLVCADNESKSVITRYALVNKKHVLIAAPLWTADFAELEQLASSNKVIFYVAYTFRFVAEFLQIKNAQLGAINYCRVTYAAHNNKLHNGALIDLGPHVLNLLEFWFGAGVLQNNFNIVHKDSCGRQVICADFNAKYPVEVEANFFAAGEFISVDVYSAHGYLHVRCDNLTAKMPALLQLEYAHFLRLCEQRLQGSCAVDKWIYTELERLAGEHILLA